MKFNRIIAGLGVVAGLGVALAPVASFATGEDITNNLTVTVNHSCSLKTVGTDTAFSAVTESLTAAAVNPGISWESGTSSTSKFDIVCNQGSKYTITATPTVLTNQQVDGATLDTYTVAYSVAGSAQTTSLTGGTDVALTGASSKVHSGTAETFAITKYSGLTEATTPAGIYTGTVTYVTTFADAQD